MEIQKAMRRAVSLSILILIFIGALYLVSRPVLSGIGGFLVVDEPPVHSDAVVVPLMGVEYYPRLIQAAELYTREYAGMVVIDGNRKNDALRALEKKGFKRCCPWYEDTLRILSICGVPRDKVLCINAEDAYDTVSEAKAVGSELIERGFSSIILTTSKFHTRRAKYIWSRAFDKKLSVHVVSAKKDPYDPRSWWMNGRQIRWVMAEYGAWLYYWLKDLTEINVKGGGS